MTEQHPLFYRKPDGGYVRPIFRIEKLREMAASVLPQGLDEGAKAYGLALIILDACFGRDWLERHILAEPKDGFLSCARHIQAEPKDGLLSRASGDEFGSAVVMHRVCHLAEMVLNFLPTLGVEAPLDQLAAGQIESAYAELSTGRALFRRGLPFRFVWPSGVRGESFDLLVMLPNGAEVCADVKCKFETKAYSASGFRNSLDDARKRNLPKGYPCAIFVNIPQLWPEQQETFSEMENVIWEFPRSTNRIVVVVVYTWVVRLYEGVTCDFQRGWEYVNSEHDFGPMTDWRAFGLNQGILPDAQGWQRLTDILRG